MTDEQAKLLREAAEWKAQNQQIREWLLTHPHLMDQEQWHAAINLTDVLGAELDRETKNSRPGRRPSLKTRSKIFVGSILTLFRDDSKKGVQWYGRKVRSSA